MSSDADKLWMQSVRALQRLKGQHPITHAEADELLAKAEEYPVTDEELEEVLRRVVAGKSLSVNQEPDLSWVTGEEVREVEEEVRACFNRNSGEADSETESREEELRAELLGQDDDDEQPNTDDGSGSPT